MKYKDAKDTVMQLINLYSERGIIISSNDKNIADFDIRARNYLNLALRTVSNRFPLTKTMSLTKVATTADEEAIAMPNGFVRIIKVYKEVDDDIEEYDHYYCVDDTHIALPNAESGKFQIRYAALSEEIPNQVSSLYELDIHRALENAVCYYAAGMLIQSERPDTASRLFEQYTELMLTYEPSKRYQRKIKRV